MKGRHPHHHSLYHALRLIESITVFLFLGMLLVLALFFLGNYQEFLDSSQNMLLVILRVTSLASAVVGFYYLIALVIWMAIRKHPLILRTLFSLLVVGVSVLLALGSELVISFLHPVAGT